MIERLKEYVITCDWCARPLLTIKAPKKPEAGVGELTGWKRVKFSEDIQCPECVKFYG